MQCLIWTLPQFARLSFYMLQRFSTTNSVTSFLPLILWPAVPLMLLCSAKVSIFLGCAVLGLPGLTGGGVTKRRPGLNCQDNPSSRTVKPCALHPGCPGTHLSSLLLHCLPPLFENAHQRNHSAPKYRPVLVMELHCSRLLRLGLIFQMASSYLFSPQIDLF